MLERTLKPGPDGLTAAARSWTGSLTCGLASNPNVVEVRADDGSRTRDLELGKLALYQLSYVRKGGRF